MSVPPNSGGGQQGPESDGNNAAPGHPGFQPPQQPYYVPASGHWAPQPGYPPAMPPPEGNRVKWLLAVVVLVLVIGLAVTTTLLLRGGGGGESTSGSTESSSAPSDIASANDTGPVSIITVEPTCTAYYAINNMVADAQNAGWGNDRNSLGPVDQWTTDQRAHVEAASTAMGRAADQLVPLAKQTPHRVVRELYEQLIAYWRAYVAALPSYTPDDNHIADATVHASIAISSLCNAITYGSAPLVTGVETVSEPTDPQPPGNPANPERFITAADTPCKDWIARQAKFASDVADWDRIDASIPASQWTTDQRAINEAAYPVISAYADSIEKAGRASGNPILEDFAVAAAVYFRAYVAVGTNYVKADGWLASMPLRLVSFVSTACEISGFR